MKYAIEGGSHGPAITVTLNEVPAGIPVDEAAISRALVLRRSGYGRSVRQNAEEDRLEILSGVADGFTTGEPVALRIENRVPADLRHWSVPRPGHADYAGCMKLGITDCAVVAEQASARETVGRVAAGCFARAYLEQQGVSLLSYVTQIGTVACDDSDACATAIAGSPVRCPDAAASVRMCAAIDEARAAGDTLGGCLVVRVRGLEAGLGGCRGADVRLDARLGAACLSIPSVKGVEFGCGFALAAMKGSESNDAFDTQDLPHRSTNNMGGIEGGMTNGEELFIRLAVKPVPTLGFGLPSFDLVTGEPALSPSPRADTCVVPAVAVIAEAEVALVLASAYQER